MFVFLARPAQNNLQRRNDQQYDSRQYLEIIKIKHQEKL